MKKTYKILSVVLAALLLVVLSSFAVFASDETPADDTEKTEDVEAAAGSEDGAVLTVGASEDPAETVNDAEESVEAVGEEATDTETEAVDGTTSETESETETETEAAENKGVSDVSNIIGIVVAVIVGVGAIVTVIVLAPKNTAPKKK